MISKELLKQLREMEAKAENDWETFHEPRNMYDSQRGLKASGKLAIDGWGRMDKNNAELACALRNNAKALLDEIERLQGENEALKNPLPTKEEEKAFYDKAYHVHNTGCGLNCQK